MDVRDKVFVSLGNLGRFLNRNLLESGCDNIVIFPSQLTLKTTPTNSSLKLPSHVNDQDNDKSDTASSRAQQMSPQFAADVSLLLSATADPVVQDLLDANKLVRDMRRSSAQSLHFHSFL